MLIREALAFFAEMVAFTLEILLCQDSLPLAQA